MQQDAGLDPNRPRALLCHSSLDQDRFVGPFVPQLREHGIDVRYAEWELLPGDSLVERIFDEGLADTDVFLIVLSEHSLNSGWIREEMDSAALRQIEEQCRVIPILLDGSDVPDVLMHTLWQRIRNPESYQQEFEGIVRAISGERARSQLDQAPTPAATAPIPGVRDIQTIALRVAGEMALEADGRLVDPHVVLQILEDSGMPEREALESLDILLDGGHVERTGESISITASGLHEYAANSLPDYEEIIERVASYLVLEGHGTDRAIAGDLRQPRLLIENILNLFAAHEWIQTSKMPGPTTYVHEVAPELSKELWS